MRILFIGFILITINISFVFSQGNTVGIISNTSNSYEGYTLFTTGKKTFLIDNCGQLIKEWASLNDPGNSVYLLDNGNLLRGTKLSSTSSINFGGTGGGVEMFDWDGNLIWEYEYNTTEHRQHHDVYPMPNGNVLMLAASVMSFKEAVQAGRNPAKLKDENGNELTLFNEQILELKPIGRNDAEIVWEWNIKDHVIQDFDITVDNFDIVADHPELLDINYLGSESILLGNSNWLHFNSIQYNATLDQIVISSRLMNEIYIIDHGTTTAEAASHTNGYRGKGGDFLYRWGNPEAYDQGTSIDKKLFGQHSPYIIPDGYPDAGAIMVYNNGFGRFPEYSEVFIIEPPRSAPGIYTHLPGIAFGPAEPIIKYGDETNTGLYSAILSSAQNLPNGNILICEGASGHFSEINANKDVVWEYINPYTANLGPMSQGEDPTNTANRAFRATRYNKDYGAFVGKSLNPGSRIELGVSNYNCDILSTNKNESLKMLLYPNPVKNILNVKSQVGINKYEIYDLLGNLINFRIDKNIQVIDVSHLKTGVYIVKLYEEYNNSITKRIVKQIIN
ncbi:aryl-sulfate sulfotransferase [Algibacter mikhailovii]|uniref:Secretion system C-terminal sorting domain-containing protein n=1 Tax=Algibacter mikhailovii TaxID=425498 RepID=A0A918R4S3_9FLAO|nr:aryl-sulfate sulfotransferase [Algibacter mikhailovii]GGZ86085.1 hypothetical protein GCM10007028_25490 [Algibacter mikhailovii]